MKTAIHLGYQVASLTLPGGETMSYSMHSELILHQAAFSEEGAFHPAASVSIGSIEQLRKLRDFLNEHIKDENEN